MSAIDKLKRGIALSEKILAEENPDIDSMRELAAWLVYSLWESDPDQPPWYGTPEELEAFRRGPNPFDPPAEKDA